MSKIILDRERNLDEEIHFWTPRTPVSIRKKCGGGFGGGVGDNQKIAPTSRLSNAPTYLPTRSCESVSVSVCVRTYVRMYVRTYVRSFVRSFVCVCVHVLSQTEFFSSQNKRQVRTYVPSQRRVKNDCIWNPGRRRRRKRKGSLSKRKSSRRGRMKRTRAGGI